MAFLVQNYQGLVQNANAYITYEFWVAYHTDQGTLPTVSPAESLVKTRIVRATRYLDSRFGFNGEKLNGGSQSTQFPRRDCYNADNEYVTDIPQAIMEACADYALIALTTDLDPVPSRDESGQRIAAKSETVGPLSTSISYAQVGSGGSGYVQPVYPPADRKIRAAGLLRSSGRVYRG